MTLTIIASILFKTIFYSKRQEAIKEPEHGDQNKGMKFQRVNQVLQKCLPLPLIIPNLHKHKQHSRLTSEIARYSKGFCRFDNIKQSLSFKELCRGEKTLHL